MNKITLQGYIKDIKYSHSINDIEYYKAQILTKRENGKEDIIPIKFKKFCLPENIKTGDEVSLTGNVRSFTSKEDDKNKVELFVHTYFDKPEEGQEFINRVELVGNICKIGYFKKTTKGKDVCDFILAVNIPNNDRFLKCYIPCCAWGKHAKKIANMPIGSELHIIGPFVSRVYKKYTSDSECILGVAYEVNIEEIVEAVE